MSTEQHTEPGHGDSPAAWTAVVLMLVGIAVGTVGFFLHYSYDTDWSWLLWGGVIIFVVGAIAGVVMKMLGYGVDGPKTVKSHQ